MTKRTLPEQIRQLNERIRSNPEMTEGMGNVHLLNVPGRTSGALRSTPVTPLTYAGQRWLVAGFAESDWVKNIRASSWGILTKGKSSERVEVVEVAIEKRAAILQAYVPTLYDSAAFPLGPDAPLEAFAAIAGNYPIFQIIKATPAASIEDAARMS